VPILVATTQQPPLPITLLHTQEAVEKGPAAILE
jgi:hypothetical protein